MTEQILRGLKDLTIEERAYVSHKSFIADDSKKYYIKKDAICSDIPFNVRVELINNFGGDLSVYMSQESQQKIPVAREVDTKIYRPVLYVENEFTLDFQNKIGSRGTKDPAQHIQNKIDEIN